jgi:O-antigen/teichoic acid export membrane protein
MTVTKRNIIANFAGQGWMALMGFLFLPFYLRLIGAEGYGLIGFFILLSSTLSLLDMGFDITAMREIAAFNEVDDNEKQRISTLLRSIELLLWAIALMIGVVVGLAAPLITTHWLNVQSTRIPEVTNGIRLMAIALVIQFPIDFYSGCLIGLQKQVKLSVINSTSGTLRGVGAVALLWLISPTAQMFFAWQCVVTAITVLLLRSSVWQNTGHRKSHRFSLASLRSVGRYTAGISVINVLGYLLTQIDKITLSKVLPLKLFGYYMLAWTLGTFAYRFIGPIFNAYYPRVAQLVAQINPQHIVNLQRDTELVKLYSRASRVMAVAIVPFSLWLAWYARELLALWTHDKGIAEAAAGAVAWIALGTLCNGLMHIPYSVQLATGQLKLAFWHNLISVLLVVPLTYYGATHYGLQGAALSWFLLNIGSVIIGSPIMYRLMMKNARSDWYRHAVAYPVLEAAFLIAVAYQLSRQLSGTLPVSALMLFSLVASIGVVALSARVVTFGDLVRQLKVVTAFSPRYNAR